MASAEIRSLTCLRGVAALWVVAYHLRHELSDLAPRALELGGWWFKTGFLGVDVFFVLSGYVISLSSADAFGGMSLRAYGDFVRRRFARIYPAYFVALLLCVGAWLMAEHVFSAPTRPERFRLGTFARSLVMLQAWDYPVAKAWNIPDWSVSSEWFVYLLFPVFARIGRKPADAFWASVVLVALLLGTLAAVEREAAMDWALPRAVVGFSVGVAICRFHQARGRSESPAAALLGLGALVSMGPAYLLARGETPLDALGAMPLVAAVVVGGLARAPARWFDGLAALNWLGRISYALYLVHDIVLFTARSAVHPSELAGSGVGARLGYVAAEILCALGLATAVHRWVERPMRARMSRKSRRSAHL